MARAGTSREQILSTTCDLLERQGYHATGMNQIIQESGAPKGSLYYYFPEGKEELAEKAIQQTAAAVVERIRAHLDQVSSPAEAIPAFVRRIAESVEASGFRAGGPLTAIAMETANTNPRLNLACRAAFASIRQAFADKLLASGCDPERAGRLSTFITAAIEGGVLLSRTEHSGDPLRIVADQIALALREF